MAQASESSLRWPRLGALGCAIAGLAIAGYLTAVHLSSGITLYCAENSVVNCEQVTTSPSSIVFGLPVAYYGVLWFVVMIALLVWGDARLARAGRLVWALGGVATVVYLLYTELFVIGVICIWCSLVHALVLAIFALTVLFPDEAPTLQDSRIA